VRGIVDCRSLIAVNMKRTMWLKSRLIETLSKRSRESNITLSFREIVWDHLSAPSSTAGQNLSKCLSRSNALVGSKSVVIDSE